MTSQASQVIDSPPRHPPVFKAKSGRNHAQQLSIPTSPVSIKPAQPKVFARLQALFPPSFPFPQSPAGLASQQDTPPLPPPPPPPQFLKTRIITWNMHDSLPKGDLEELLGSVPLHTPRNFVNDVDRIRIPGLSMEDGHPYHIIVVAGQECPTLSGIPLGLAANFKHKEAKDREKEMEAGGGERDLLHQTKHILSKHLKHENTSQNRLPDSPRSDLVPDVTSSHSPMPTSGWSAVLEDWFSNGVGSLHDVKPVVTRTIQNPTAFASSPSSPEYQLPDTVDVDWKPNSPSAASSSTPPTSSIKTRKGPYELLVKERLMGIYTAVYIHRDVKPLVRGVSTGAVPAGLIGGRLGNKGGVGVSVDLHGTTLLFINAHLAAHEGKVPLRVANLAKIKAELPLESWLAPDDPRTLAEDLTDRFDHSWIFGDLNFRLDISRLHADWLISRKDYLQAFEFDQLHKLMESGEGTFARFKEAKIDFPPTFKYDVMRTLKRDKSKQQRNHRRFRMEPDEKDVDRTNDSVFEGDEDDEHGEFGSLHSSAWTSIHSRHLDPMEDENDSEPSPSNSTGGGLIHSSSSKLVSRAAFKAKTAWMALLESSRGLSPTTESPRVRRKPSTARLGIPGSAIELSRESKVNPEPRFPAPILRRSVSAKSPLAQLARDGEHSTSEDDKGVYDSSSKKRVPSWCDRILWKTTIEPPEDPPTPEPLADQESQLIHTGGRPNRVGQLFLHAFRPRPRRNSLSPESPIDQLRSRGHSDNPAKSRLLPISKNIQHTPLSTSPGLYQSKSLEPSPAFDGSVLTHIRRNRSASATVTDSVLRRQSMPVYSPTPHLPLNPRRAETDQVSPPPSELPSASLPSPVTPASRVPSKRWFLNLLSRDHTPEPIIANTASAQPPQTALPLYRKGEIVCLSYRTLDDGQMRRLEGRSDHRPVIGSYAIHI